MDIAFLAIFAIMMARGFFRGLVKEAISLAGVFFAYFGSFYISDNYGNNFRIPGIHNADIVNIIIFTCAFFAIMLLFALLSMAVTGILNLLKLGFCNRIGGFFLPELRLSFSLA